MEKKILHQSSWARTSTGELIDLYSSVVGAERPILFIGGVHGDEPEGVQLAQDLLAWLSKNNSSELHSWLLVPCLNVDGYAVGNRVNANGVDLNRNFAASDWSADSKGPRYYPGSKAGSEPEVQAITQLIAKFNPVLIVHFHSWEPCVVYTGQPGMAAAELLAKGTGYKASEDIGYPTPGSLGQYGWQVCQTPVICIEAQMHSDLATIWPIFGPGLKSLLSRVSFPLTLIK